MRPRKSKATPLAISRAQNDQLGKITELKSNIEKSLKEQSKILTIVTTCIYGFILVNFIRNPTISNIDFAEIKLQHQKHVGEEGYSASKSQMMAEYKYVENRLAHQGKTDEINQIKNEAYTNLLTFSRCTGTQLQPRFYDYEYLSTNEIVAYLFDLRDACFNQVNDYAEFLQSIENDSGLKYNHVIYLAKAIAYSSCVVFEGLIAPQSQKLFIENNRAKFDFAEPKTKADAEQQIISLTNFNDELKQKNKYLQYINNVIIALGSYYYIYDMMLAEIYEQPGMLPDVEMDSTSYVFVGVSIGLWTMLATNLLELLKSKYNSFTFEKEIEKNKTYYEKMFDELPEVVKVSTKKGRTLNESQIILTIYEYKNLKDSVVKNIIHSILKQKDFNVVADEDSIKISLLSSSKLSNIINKDIKEKIQNQLAIQNVTPTLMKNLSEIEKATRGDLQFYNSSNENEFKGKLTVSISYKDVINMNTLQAAFPEANISEEYINDNVSYYIATTKAGIEDKIKDICDHIERITLLQIQTALNSAKKVTEFEVSKPNEGIIRNVVKKSKYEESDEQDESAFEEKETSTNKSTSANDNNNNNNNDNDNDNNNNNSLSIDDVQTLSMGLLFTSGPRKVYVYTNDEYFGPMINKVFTNKKGEPKYPDHIVSGGLLGPEAEFKGFKFFDSNNGEVKGAPGTGLRIYCAKSDEVSINGQSVPAFKPHRWEIGKN